MHAIAEAMNIEIQIYPMRWSDAVSSLEAGRLDAIQGMAKTPLLERKNIDLHNPPQYILLLFLLKGKRII